MALSERAGEEIEREKITNLYVYVTVCVKALLQNTDGHSSRAATEQ